MDKYLMIQSIFAQNANEETAQSMSSYMRNQFNFYGIPSPLRKSLYKDFLKNEKQNKAIDWTFLNQLNISLR